MELSYKPLINVTDKINGDEANWKSGDIILINAGTNTGKSHFVRESLYEQAKNEGSRILFIFNRVKLRNQNDDVIKGKEDVITTINYQAIEKVILRGEKFNFSTFKYIVCDECHYFTTDSKFNKNSDLSFNSIVNANNCIRIFMTATGKTIFAYINERLKKKCNVIPYRIDKDNSRIRAIAFYNEDSVVETFFNKKLQPDEKVLYFCRSIEMAYNLKNKYEDSIFVCSEASDDKSYVNKLDKQAIEEMIQSKKLNHKFVFTTTTLDNGVEFLDESIKYIVCDIRDTDVLLQCIGRKRFNVNNENDKVSIIVKNVTNAQLNGMSRTLKTTVDEVETFINEGVDAWIKKKNDRFGNSDFCIYDKQGMNKYSSNKKINPVKFLKVKSDYAEIKEMLKEDIEVREMEEMLGRKGKSYAFIRHICNLLGQDKYTLLDEVYGKFEISNYLESLVGKKLYKEDQEQLSERMNIKHDGKLMKSREVLNSSLEELGLDYTIKPPKKDNVRKLDNGELNPNRNKMYWMIYRIIK